MFGALILIRLEGSSSIPGMSSMALILSSPEFGIGSPDDDATGDGSSVGDDFRRRRALLKGVIGEEEGEDEGKVGRELK